MNSSEVWNQHSTQWNHVGPPLRPSPDDIFLMRQLLAEHCFDHNNPPCRALLLGVTPELARMNWPTGTRLTSLDQNLTMIERIWPGREIAGGSALCGNWTAMPVADETLDVIVSDCCFSSVAYPELYHALADEIARALNRDGVFAMRAFIRPAETENLEEVFSDLQGGRIGNFHVFKWRFAMSLHGELSEGVRLADIWNEWNRHVPDPVALADSLRWPIATIRTIDAYRNLEIRYTFPRLDELREILAEKLVEAACVYPDYELGERCPTLLFRKRQLTSSKP